MSVYRYLLTDRHETLTMIADGDNLDEATRILTLKFGVRLVRAWSEESMIRCVGDRATNSASGGFNDAVKREPTPMQDKILPARRPPCKTPSERGGA